MITILFVIILLAGLYMTWSIGANDVANAIGTSVGSRALTLRNACIMAAILEFSGAFFFGSHVTHTLQDKIFNTQLFGDNPITLVLGMLAVLMGSASWIVTATYFGLPISTTHSIVGSLLGFAIAVGGIGSIYWGNIAFIGSSWIASPLIGGLISFALFNLLRRKIFFQPNPFHAAKKATPFIVFMFFLVSSFVVLYQEFPQFSKSFTALEALSISLAISALASVISYFILRTLLTPTDEVVVMTHHPDVNREIEKTKKYLLRLQKCTTGHTQERINNIMDQFEEVSGDLVKNSIDEIHVPSFIAVEKIFAVLQVMSAALMAFSHGSNDVANAIGPVAIAINALMSNSITPNADVPSWLLALGGFGIVVGLATWGWRVIETIGSRITELTPTRGFTAEFGAAITILIASRVGLPISATHTLVGAVLGVGFARGIEALNLRMIRDIILSWIITIPIGAFSTIGFYYLIRLFI